MNDTNTATQGKAPRAAASAGPPVAATEPKSNNLPAISKQTAGGIGGAIIGGVIGGPVGAFILGIGGALVGNASAAGHRPIGKTVDSIRSVAEEPARKAYAHIAKKVSPKSSRKASSKTAATETAAEDRKTAT